jgi:hypothetical protein
LKLSHYLSQYLLRQNELTLAGIGHFRREAAVADGNTSDHEIAYTLHFREDPSAKTDPELVSFIAYQSGKMKSLAASDLESYLELARQFLNIGKSFWIEGIGTLSKNQSGHFVFTADPVPAEKEKDSTAESHTVSTSEDSFSNYEEMFSAKKNKLPRSGRIALWLFIVVGIILTVWGGYFVYQKKQKKLMHTEQPAATPMAEKKITPLPADTLTTGQITDSTAAWHTYKFIIEEAFRNRALTRYNNLKNYGLPVEMETTDSVRFRLFFRIKATPSDTAKLRDSLQRWYGTTTKTYIEQ